MKGPGPFRVSIRLCVCSVVVVEVRNRVESRTSLACVRMPAVDPVLPTLPSLLLQAGKHRHLPSGGEGGGEGLEGARSHGRVDDVLGARAGGGEAGSGGAGGGGGEHEGRDRGRAGQDGSKGTHLGDVCDCVVGCGGGGVGWGGWGESGGRGVCKVRGLERVGAGTSEPGNTRPRDQRDVRAVRGCVLEECVVGGEAGRGWGSRRARGRQDGVCVCVACAVVGGGEEVEQHAGVWAAAAGCVGRGGEWPGDACGAKGGGRVCLQNNIKTNAPGNTSEREKTKPVRFMNNTTGEARGEEVGRNTHLLLHAHAGHAPESEGGREAKRPQINVRA